MTAIPRKTQKIFGANLTPTGNVAVFGSLKAGAPAYSNDPESIQALAAFENGLNDALIGNRSPAVEDLNGLLLLVTQQLAYVLQSGIPEWDDGTTYYPNQFVRVAGVLYICTAITSTTGDDPTTDANNWSPYFAKATGPSLAAAWAVFDGINESSTGVARLIASHNVDTVSKVSAGQYVVNFLNALPSANYVMTGSCGSEDGQVFGAGDNGVVVGNLTGAGNAVRSTTACRVFTIDPSTKLVVQSGCVSVVFFA